jgi:protocatechuate 3,4-dioxygenase beta subunit
MRLTVIASLLLLGLPQQVPTLQQPTGPKGSIEGLVLHAGTKEPIAGARVTITSVQQAPTALPAAPGTPPPGATVATAPAAAPAGSPAVPQRLPAVNTDAQGKFVFQDVEPGLYSVQAASNGFARAEYGQRTVGSQGRPVTVSADQTTRDLVIQMTPAGYVSGRVRDLAGQPVVGVPVQIIKASYGPNGQRTYQSAGNTRTNDRGEYRLYWVTPGRYYLNAGSTQGAPVNLGGGGASPNEVQDVYVSTYYPNVTDISFATGLNVQPGNEISGIDFSVSRQQLYRIRGRIIDARTDRPPQTVTLTFSSRSLTGGGFMMNAGPNMRYNNADGSFEIRDMAPGSYGIGAQVPDPGSQQLSPLQSTQPRAQLGVTVVNADVENIVLVILPPASLPGRMTIDGQPLTALTSLDRMRVQLTSTTDMSSFIALSQFQSSQSLAGDGSFKIDNLMPGDYRVTVNGMPPGYYLKSVRLDQTEGGIDQPLRVSSTSSGPLEVLISANAGEINGTVLDEKQQPVRDTQAVLVPDQQRNRFDLYRTARSDQNGRFTFRGLPPGDYKVFAWELLEPFAYYDPEVMRVFEARGKLLHVTESSKQTVDVRIIPPTEP